MICRNFSRVVCLAACVVAWGVSGDLPLLIAAPAKATATKSAPAAKTPVKSAPVAPKRDPQAVAVDELFHAPVDSRFIAKFDGSKQRYVLLVPKSYKKGEKIDVVITLHGHGSDRWQYIRTDRGECFAPRAVASKRGMLVVSPDYRARTSWMGPAAEADMVQLIGHLKTRFAIRRVYLVGASMGGTSVLTFAVLHPELVDGVCSQNGLANFHGYGPKAAGIDRAIIESFGGTEKQKPEEYRKRSSELNAEKLTMPVAITTGGKDTLVPPDSVLRLATALKKTNRDVFLIHRPERGHYTTYEDTVDAFNFVIEAAERRAKGK